LILKIAKAEKENNNAFRKARANTKASPKAKGKTLPKAKANTLPKAKARLTKASLAKLGSMTLQDKVELAAGSAQTPEAAAAALQKGLSKVEHSKLWGQHNTFLQKNPEVAKQHDALPKAEKGLAVALWYVQKKAPKFLNVGNTMGATHRLEKADAWLSHLQMTTQKFSEADLERHLCSGRVIWREDPRTPGVYEYKDLYDVKRFTEVDKGKRISINQELKPMAEEEELFGELFDKAGDSLCVHFM